MFLKVNIRKKKETNKKQNSNKQWYPGKRKGKEMLVYDLKTAIMIAFDCPCLPYTQKKQLWFRL